MPGPSSLLDGVGMTSSPPPTGGGPIVPGPYSQKITGSQAPVGTAPLAGAHNQSLHIAAVGLASLGVILIMHKWGFRLVSVGRYGGGR